MKAPAAALVAAAVGAAALAGCGDDDDVGPAAYAQAVCASVKSWRADLSESIEELAEEGEATPAGAGRKRLVLGFLDEAVRRTGRFADEVGAAGAPALDGGERLSADLVASVAAVGELYGATRAEAEALPENDPEPFVVRLVGVGNDVEKGRAKLRQSIEDLSERYAYPGLAAPYARDYRIANAGCQR